MTDEERQRLCAALRVQVTEGWFYCDSEDACHGIVRPMGDVAADEIERLAALAQSDAEAVAWPDIDAAVKAGLATRNPAPDAAPSAYSNVKTVTLGGTAPPDAQSDAEPRPDVRRILDRLMFCEECLRAGVPDEYFGWAGDQPSLGELAQSDAGPVAWQYREPNGEWQMCDAATDIYYRTSKYELRPLYTAPPRPDASAGLIEAAEMAEQCANGSFSKNEAMYLRGFADRLRARAAEGSGK